MGARCSSAGIVMPSKKFSDSSSVPNSERGKRNSVSNPRGIHSEQITPRGVISAENATSVTIKQRRVQTEVNEGSQKFDTGSPLNETNNSKSTEMPNVRGLYQYKKGPLIGKGSYGEVYECLNLNTGELLAVKSFKVHGDLAKVLAYVENLKKEVVVLKNLAHENIVKYYTTEISDVKDGDHVTVDIVQEYVSGGSVRKLLDKFNKLEEKVVATYVRQVLQGLHYLHMQGIYHRNIKGSNILIDTSGTIKLTEFGISGRPDRFTEDGTENKTSKNAHKTPSYWSAPEVVLKKSQGMPADIWSVGCIVIEMLTGSPPWTGQINNHDDFTKKMAAGAIPTFPTDLSESCKDFLIQIFKATPDQRPTVIDLLEHAFVREDDNLNNSSYMEAETVMGGGLSRGVSGNFLNLVDGRHSDRPFNRTKTGNNTITRQDSNASGFEDMRQNSSLSGYKDFMAGFRGNAADSVSGGSSVTRQNSDDKQMVAMFKAYGFDAGSRQNSADKNHLVAFKANAFDSVSRQNSEDKGQLAAFKAGNMDFRMKTEHTKNIANLVNNLRNVEEERDEEETATPLHNGNANFMRFNSAAKAGGAQIDQPQNKEDMRRQLEEKMMRDLMRMNTGHLEEYGLGVEEDEDGDNGDENKTKAQSPLRNKLVENIDSSKKKKGMYDFNGPSGPNGSNNKKVVMITEMEMDEVKQKLRKEFEQQLESSLARINTEKLTHLIQREPVEAPSVERHTTMAPRMIKKTMLTEDSAENENENIENPIWAQNFGEDLGSFRGFSENTNFGTDNKLERNPSNMTESENNSPLKKKVEFLTQDSNNLGMILEEKEATDAKSVINMKRIRQAQPQVV